MGALLSLLRGSSGGHSGSLSRSSRETQASARFSKQFNEFISTLGDVRNSQHVDAHFPQGSRLVRVGNELLERVSAYQDGSNEVRTAISQPTPENEEAAWRKIGPSVMLLKECFELAQEIESMIPDLLDELCNHAIDGDPGRNQKNRGLARLLADIMQNAFAFDALKASIPAIQNDFSYYRRTLSRIAKSQNAEIAGYTIPHDVSNQMSLFYAYYNPMVKTVVDSATQFAKDSGDEQAVLDCLSALATGSFNAVKQGRADSPKSERMCVLVLVTCCVLYDWVSPQGVGSPQSGIDAKAALDLISERTLVDTTPADKVLRANYVKCTWLSPTNSPMPLQNEHRLVLRQEPNRSRMCGIGEKADRRPVDPPPIIQLHVSDPTTANNRVYLHNPYYFMYATLMDERGERELNTLSDKKARTMTGSVVASLAHLKDIDGNDGAFFVFPDLSVRCEGIYRLKFSLFEIVGNQVFFCKSITSAMFTVYSAKKFPGMEESTRLTKLFAEQGLKIRVRKEQKTGRPKGARSRPIATALHSDLGRPPNLPTWNDPRAHNTGTVSYPGLPAQSEPLQQPSSSTASMPTMHGAAGSGANPMQPTPWSAVQGPHPHAGAGHTASQSPQPRPMATHYSSRLDMPRPHEPDALRTTQRPFPPQQQQQQQQHGMPGEHMPFRGHHPSAGYPPAGAGSLPPSTPHYLQQMPPAHPQNKLHASGPFLPRRQTTSQTLPPMYEATASTKRHSPYIGDSSRSSGEYHENTLPSMSYNPSSGYRQGRTPEDSMRQQTQFGHQHRPWSPHRRTQQQQQQQQHYNPAPPSHVYSSDSRYSPYSRFVDATREARQHAHAGLRTNPATSPSSEGVPTYADQAHGRYYQLGSLQHHSHRMPSSTPDNAGGAGDKLRGLPPFSSSMHGSERQFVAQSQPQRHQLPPPRAVVESPSPASARPIPASSCARQSDLPAPTGFEPATVPRPPASPAGLPATGLSLAPESPQRRIAVHSLLVSDSSSSPERAKRSP
ncbi:hypothetical protein EV183_003011 [Coemansia sp. RSA 2336]|nr:hypothetical protein EV183_003011 [Coemansia sp. RSA 2336]